MTLSMKEQKKKKKFHETVIILKFVIVIKVLFLADHMQKEVNSWEKKNIHKFIDFIYLS